MDDFEEENTEKEFRLDINLNNFVRKLCAAMINAFQGGRG